MPFHIEIHNLFAVPSPDPHLEIFVYISNYFLWIGIFSLLFTNILHSPNKINVKCSVSVFLKRGGKKESPKCIKVVTQLGLETYRVCISLIGNRWPFHRITGINTLKVSEMADVFKSWYIVCR